MTVQFKVPEELLAVQEYWFNLAMLGRPCFQITNCSYSAPPTKAPNIKYFQVADPRRPVPKSSLRFLVIMKIYF